MPANLVFRRKIWGARDNGIPPRSTPVFLHGYTVLYWFIIIRSVQYCTVGFWGISLRCCDALFQRGELTWMLWTLTALRHYMMRYTEMMSVSSKNSCTVELSQTSPLSLGELRYHGQSNVTQCWSNHRLSSMTEWCCVQSTTQLSIILIVDYWKVYFTNIARWKLRHTTP